MQNLYRQIPNMNHILECFNQYDENFVKSIADPILSDFRHQISEGQVETLSEEMIIAQISIRIDHLIGGCYKRLINASGIVIHTNLGRSIISNHVLNQATAKWSGYSNLEYDLVEGNRGSRYDLVEDLICHLTGAESAIVVNNNAAAVMLVLAALAHEKEVIVSRGELVEIGGSFRIPNVMALSGAKLVEIGTTNKTHLYDYDDAISDDTALIMKVHTSNYKILGFTESVPIKAINHLVRGQGILTYEDLGSGQIIDIPNLKLNEPTVSECISAGTDIVSFSGDKLLGGPQAGIICGKKSVIDKIKKHQLLRALRIDKFSLGILEETLKQYLNRDTLVHIETYRMLTLSKESIKTSIEKFMNQYGDSLNLSYTIEPISGQVGGGSLPLYDLDSYGLCISGLSNVSASLESLRHLPLPIIARIKDDKLIFDFRTILEEDYPSLGEALGGLR